MFRVITLNLNGIRSAAKKGFFEWMEKQNADVICLQETKCLTKELTDKVFYPAGYHAYFFDADKKGYSGVGIYTKHEPDKIITGLGFKSADTEGRYIQADFGNLSVASIYLPSGSSGEERQVVKFDFMKHYQSILEKISKEKRDFIICGDWNIVHKRIDIKNWTSNQKNSGCLPEERAWLDNVLTHLKFVDAFRELNHEPDQYTWWSNRGQAYAKNVGWRIDYQVLTPDLKNKVKHVSIYKDQRFSDHAPVVVDYDLDI